MKTVILAAGEGARLEPLTNVRPKPMLPVANRPVLEYVIESVRDAGLDDVILVVGYERERIQNHFGDGDDWGVDIEYVIQRTQLGSGHALLQAEPYIGDDLLVLNGDQIVESDDIEAVVEAHQRTGDAVLAATRSADAELYGVVEIDGEFVTAIREKPPKAIIDSDLVNAGIYAFGPDVFAALRATEVPGELGLPATLGRFLDDHPVRAVSYDGPWLDVTWPWDLLAVNGHLLDRRVDAPREATVHETATVVDGVACARGVKVDPNATVLRGTALGENVTVGANAVVENCVIMPDATIGAGAVLKDCVVGANVTVGPGTVAEGGDADVVIDGALHEGVRFGGVVGDNARLGGSVTVAPGTRLGNDSEVERGCVLDGHLPPGSRVFTR